MTTLILLSIIAWFLNKLYQSNKIRPITHDAELYDASKITQPQNLPPLTKGEWTSVFQDEKLLRNYAKYLDAHKKAVEDQANSVITAFNEDHQVLIRLQRKIIRTTLSTNSKLRRFDELTMLNSCEKTPKAVKLTIPAIPNYKTPQQFAQQYSLVPGHIGYSLGRLLSGSSSGNHPVIAVVSILIATTIAAVQAKEKISCATRAVEEGYGLIASFSNDLNTTVSLLARAHNEMVLAFSKLCESQAEITQLTKKLSAIPVEITSLNQLNAEDRQTVTNLYFWTLAASQLSQQHL